VFYRADCPRCQEELPKYARLADQWRVAGSDRRVAAIKVPPYGDEDMRRSLHTSAIVFGALSDVREWFIELPMSFRVVEGNVLMPG